MSSRFEIVARGLTFEAPDSVAAGWITFAFDNQSAMTHFALIEKLPDGIGLEEQQKEVAPIFQQGMDLLAAGKQDEAFAAFGGLPAWFGDIGFVGGPGLLAPGQVSEVVAQLAPGRYLIECYVKTSGVFHSYNPDTTGYGMVYEFMVTSDSSSAPEPVPTTSVYLSGTGGIRTSGDLTAGDHIVAVHFEDQVVHENFVGHDLHLARLSDESDIESLVNWMNWSVPGGLETPAPVEFVGGVNEMPAGSTAYLKVSLTPGRYAWVSEVPASDKKSLLQVFTVTASS